MAAASGETGKPARQTVLLALDPEDFPDLAGARQSLLTGEPALANPVLRPRPGHWDGTRCKVYGTVLVDPADGLFKMWYSGGTDTPDSIRRECGSPRHLGYAFSLDGIHWQRPELGIIEYNGSRANNLVLLDAQTPNVFLLADSADPARRFMMFAQQGQLTNNCKLLYSGDGVRWQRDDSASIDSGDWGTKTHEPFSILYDPLDPDPQRRWKGYSLLHVYDEGYRGRAVGLFTAAEPNRWVEHPEQPILAAIDGMESEIHIPHVSRFHDTYVMLYDAMEPNHHTQAEIAVSRDGVRFRRVQSGVKVIPNGPPGSVNAGKVCVSPRSLFTHNGRIWWYHTVSCDTYQTGPRGLMAAPWHRYTNLVTWREDGFACLEPTADLESSAATTAVLTADRDEALDVWLNAVVPSDGSIVVELLDGSGRTLASSLPWQGDELRGPVKWSDAPRPRPGEPFRLRLRMNGRMTKMHAIGVSGARRAALSQAPQSIKRPNPPQTRWTFSADAKISGSPVVWRDLVLANSWDQHLYAIDVATGRCRWKFRTGNSITTSPAVDGDRVFISSRDGNIYAVDAASGSLLWKSPVHDGKKFNGFNPNGAWIDCSPTVGAYAPRWNALMRDPKTKQWMRKLEDAPPRYLFVGAHDRQMHAFDLRSGVEMWRTPTFNWILSRPAVDNYTVYFGSMDGHVYALDAQCGALKWRYKAGQRLMYAPQVVRGSVVTEAVCGSPLVRGETVYVGGDDGFLYALDAASGEQRWAVQTDKWIWGRPLLCGPMLVFGSADGRVYGVDASSGRVAWKTAVGNAVYADIVAWRELALVADTSGRLSALRPADGSVAWTVEAGAGMRAAPAVADDGTIYLPTCAGELHAIDRAG